MSDTVETCGKWVPHGGRAVTGTTCGRPVKADGLCGIHLAAKRRREDNDRKREDASSANEARKQGALALCERLAKVGVLASPAYSWYKGEYTGGITVTSPADATSLVTLAERATSVS